MMPRLLCRHRFQRGLNSVFSFPVVPLAMLAAPPANRLVALPGSNNQARVARNPATANRLVALPGFGIRLAMLAGVAMK